MAARVIGVNGYRGAGAGRNGRGRYGRGDKHPIPTCANCHLTKALYVADDSTRGGLCMDCVDAGVRR